MIISNKSIFNDTCLLITGGTGSFGQKFVEMTLKKYNPNKIIIYSRDEMKQWEMQKKFNSEKLKFIIGDIRDYNNLYKALRGVDYVVHAAATKIVPTAESNPDECVKTNIIGSMNLIDACVDREIKKVVALSTDKACNPVNLYGATKLAADKLFIAGNTDTTKLSLVRYGNVMGSRGSVIPYFLSLKNVSELPITDTRMTRFMISLEESIALVWKVFDDMVGGEVFVKKIPSMLVTDIAKAVNPKAKHKVIGIRPGEKIHEKMISEEDSMYTFEYEEYFKIIPATFNENERRKSTEGGVQVNDNFVYASDSNKEWMEIDELRMVIDALKLKAIMSDE